jgi:Ca2+-binding EF-hand superfamily protein
MRTIIFAATAAALMIAGGAASAQPAPGQGPPDPAAVIARMDTNKDGAIQKDEAQGRLAERFDMIDANHDGKITAEELAAAMAAMRAQRQHQQGGQ